MTIVVDASVAAKWYIQEPETPLAEAIRDEGPIIAPDLIIAEVMNAAWKHIRLGRFSLDQARRLALSLRNSFAELIPSTALAADAIEIAVALNHPVYDAFYLAAAERSGAELVTADRALFRKTRGTRFAKRVRPLMS